MTLEMLDVDWQKHFGPLNFNKMIVEFYQHIPRGLLRSIIQHMERTDPDQLAELLDQGKTSPVIDSSLKVETMKYIPLTKERVDFLLSLLLYMQGKKFAISSNMILLSKNYSLLSIFLVLQYLKKKKMSSQPLYISSF